MMLISLSGIPWWGGHSKAASISPYPNISCLFKCFINTSTSFVHIYPILIPASISFYPKISYLRNPSTSPYPNIPFFSSISFYPNISHLLNPSTFQSLPLPIQTFFSYFFHLSASSSMYFTPVLLLSYPNFQSLLSHHNCFPRP